MRDKRKASYLILLILLAKLIFVSFIDRAITRMWISSSFHVYLTLIDFTDKSAFKRIPLISHNIKLPLQSVWCPKGQPRSSLFFLLPSTASLPSATCAFPSPLQLSHTLSQTTVTLLSDHSNYFVFSLLHNEYFLPPNYFITSIDVAPFLGSCGQECYLESLLYCSVHLALRINQRLPHPICGRIFPTIKKS